MDVDEFSVPYGHSSEQIPCWLHPTGSKTLVLLIHGHNHHGDSRMFRAVAEELQENGINVCRFSMLREETPKGVLVNSLTEEVAQAKTVLEHIRPEYDKIIVAGHSQASIIALQIALDGDADGIVFLMPLIDTQAAIERRLESFQLSLDDLAAQKYFSYPLADGTLMLYTPAFFEDLQMWDVPAMLTQWYGPSLFFAGLQDQKISAEEVEQGYSIANEPKDYSEVDCDHLFPEHAKEIADKMLQWINEQGFGTNEELF